MFEREPSMTRKMIGVRVRLEHPRQFDPLSACGAHVLLDPKRGVDDDRETRVGVTDEVRRTTEVVVHELLEEQHGS